MERARMLIALLIASIAQVGQAQNILEVSSQEAKKIFGIAEGHRIPLSADRAIEVALSETPGDLPSILKITISENDRKILEKKIKNKEAADQMEALNQQAEIEKQIAVLKLARQSLQKEML